MPVGRPRGSVNTPNPLRAALKDAIPGKRPHRKPAAEFFQGTKHITMKMDAITYAALEIHAARRGHTPLTWMIQDILNLWTAASTDYDQAIFREMLPPKARAARAPERYVGYIESLGFTPAAQAPSQPPTTPADIPADISLIYHHTLDDRPAHTPATTAQAIPERSIADLATAYRHPMAHGGPASYPHPTPTIPQGASVFNPQEHMHPAGRGSAAQDVQQGRTPQDELPPLAEDVRAMLDFYKVNPDDIR